MVTLSVGQTLIVRKALPCRRESNRRHATLPDGQEIIVLSVAPVSGHVRFLTTNQGQQETFTTFQSTIERCCAEVKKPAASKGE